MPGRVPAHLIVGGDGQSWTIEPTVCPVADDHRKDAAFVDALLAPKCQEFNVGFGRRTCPYWYATTLADNAAHRVDGSTVWEQAVMESKSQVRCGVLCMGAKRNRAPGV